MPCFKHDNDVNQSQNRKLNYAHARKSLPVALATELLFLGKLNLRSKCA